MAPAVGLLVALCADVAAQEAPAPLPAGGPALSWTFGDGLRVRVSDMEARIRTRLHMDLLESNLEDVGAALGEDFDDAERLRRARWLTDVRFQEGSPLEDVRVRGQVDFASSEIDWKDLFVRHDGAPRFGVLTGSNVRAGQFRQPFGLEAMTSVSHLAFIERSTATNAFTPGRGRGAQWAGRTDSWTLQAGAFRVSEGLPFPDELGTGRSVVARVLHQPRDAGLVQIGGGLALREPGADGIVFRARPGTRLAPQVVDTGTLEADRFLVGALEGLYLGDGWAMVAEWFHAAGQGVGPEDASPRFMGGHVSFQTFLREGQVTWNKDRGGLRAAKVPDAWTTRENGPGAVELAARLSWVDLDDGPVRGGRSLDLELGVNWYLQPATRFMLHWVGARVDAPGGDEEHGTAILARLQVQL